MLFHLIKPLAISAFICLYLVLSANGHNIAGEETNWDSVARSAAVGALVGLAAPIQSALAASNAVKITMAANIAVGSIPKKP